MDKGEALMTRVAWLYYVQGLTQDEIAGRLRLSRTKVVRLLAKAKETGLVRIEVTITSPFKVCLELETRLRERFQLRDAVVVPTGQDEQQNKVGIAKAGAFLLERILKERDILGAGWGTTVYEVGRQMRYLDRRDLTLVQLMGGINAIAGHTPPETVKLLATKLGAKGYWLNTPFVVDSPEIKEAILSDVGIRQVLDMAKMVRVALVSIGDVGERSLWVTSDVFSRELMSHLYLKGAVGDILGQFFNIHGEIVHSNFENRIIALPLSELSQIPVVIGVAGGEHKIEAILGALRGRFINILVTDEATAHNILLRANDTCIVDSG